MTAVANGEHGGSKLLWKCGGEVKAVVGTSQGLSKTPRLVGTQTWTSSSSSKMSRSHHGGEGGGGGGKALLMGGGGKEEQAANKHTWPRRRDVSSIFFDPRAVHIILEEGGF